MLELLNKFVGDPNLLVPGKKPLDKVELADKYKSKLDIAVPLQFHSLKNLGTLGGELTLAGANIDWQATAKGPALNVSAEDGGYAYLNTGIDLDGTFNFSVSMQATISALPSGDVGLFSYADTEISGNPQVYVQLQSTGDIRFYIYNTYRLTVSSAVQAGDFVTIGVTWADGLWTFYINGVTKGTYASSSFTAGINDYIMYIGSGFGGQPAAKYHNVALSLSHAFNAAEMMQLHRDPYHIYRPASSSVYILPASAGGVSLPKFIHHYRNQGIM